MQRRGEPEQSHPRGGSGGKRKQGQDTPKSFPVPPASVGTAPSPTMAKIGGLTCRIGFGLQFLGTQWQYRELNKLNSFGGGTESIILQLCRDYEGMLLPLRPPQLDVDNTLFGWVSFLSLEALGFVFRHCSCLWVSGFTQRLQYPLIKEYAINLMRNPTII